MARYYKTPWQREQDQKEADRKARVAARAELARRAGSVEAGMEAYELAVDFIRETKDLLKGWADRRRPVLPSRPVPLPGVDQVNSSRFDAPWVYITERKIVGECESDDERGSRYMTQCTVGEGSPEVQANIQALNAWNALYQEWQSADRKLWCTPEWCALREMLVPERCCGDWHKLAERFVPQEVRRAQEYLIGRFGSVELGLEAAQAYEEYKVAYLAMLAVLHDRDSNLPRRERSHIWDALVELSSRTCSRSESELESAVSRIQNVPPLYD